MRRAESFCRFGSKASFIRAALMPIRVKSTVHTTGKTHEGGESGGVSISLYKDILLRVKNAEIVPTSSANATE